MDDYIKYSSTRGGDDSLSYEEVLLSGLARDGGLLCQKNGQVLVMLT